MHHQAELGIAAHWRYKENSQTNINDKYINEIRNYLNDELSIIDISEPLIDYDERIFAVTPKGDVIEMTKNSTPLDFAYHIHTNIGHSCIGAKINGKIAQLTQKINNGDVVFIYSNEFFDAIGSKQFIYNNGNFNEIKISKNNNEYLLIKDSTIISRELLNYYSSYNFKDNDILEHSNLILNILSDIQKLECKKYFFTTTDYGYTKLHFKSTLRLLSNHKKLNLFDKFENVDYSFGVNFELMNSFFLKNNPSIIYQKDLILNNLPSEYLKSSNKNIKEMIDLISGKKFGGMGTSFLNLSFKENE